MAQSPAHKFGQIIGDLLEATLRDPLQRIADEYGLYLDYGHPRPARNNRRKVSWVDHKGNAHDLDYVLELGGSEEETGTPKAFIETAWRRYTKHSRNKAQELQGAIVPLAETYSDASPFLGAVLAGVYTEGSLQQLRSHGFGILYFPYESICDAFSAAGIDAAFDEDTPDSVLKKKVNAYQRLSGVARESISRRLREVRSENLDGFLRELKRTLGRRIQRILILALHGRKDEVRSVKRAIRLIELYDETTHPPDFVRYELEVRYNNGDAIRAEFSEKAAAIEFLRGLT